LVDSWNKQAGQGEEKFLQSASSTNSDYTAALMRIRSIVRGRGDNVTKIGKVSDVLAGIHFHKAENDA
jgi:hypothetical protein